MKRNYILFAVAAIVAAASCQKAAQTSHESQAGGNEMVFNASAEETKAILSEKDINWESTDRIAVYDGTALNNFAAFNVNGKNASFGGPAAEAESYTAIYPYAAAGLAEGALSVTIPEQQTVDATHPVDPAAIVAVAKAAKGSDLAFSNKFSLVKVTIAESGIKSVLLKGLGSEMIAGTAALAPDLSLGAGSASQVVLNYAGGEAFPAGSYYIAIYPTTFAGGFSVVLSKTDGAKGMKQTTAETEFARNSGVNLKTLTVGTWVPAEIMNADQLKMWNLIAPFYTAGETAKLGADIDLAGAQWTPVEHFDGVFDGQNHRIYNIVMNATNSVARYGFINKLNGTFKNTCFGSSDYDFSKGSAADAGAWDNTSLIELKNDLTPTGWVYAAPIAYTDEDAKIQNVVNFMPVTATDATDGQIRLGGITAILKGNNTIDGCTNFGDILDNAFGCTTTNYKCAQAGICAWIDGEGSVVSNCTNWGSVTNLNPTAVRSAGIVGTTNANKVTGCVNHGDVINSCACADVIYIGGTVGYTGDGAATLEKCTNYGNIKQTAETTGVLQAGGIVGYMRQGSVLKGCVNADPNTFVGSTAKCGGHAYIGGLVGAVNAGTITKADDGTRNSNAASLASNNDFADGCNFLVGGIVGYVAASTPVSYCDNSGAVSTSTNVSPVESESQAKTIYLGGIAGYDKATSAFSECTNSGIVTGNSKDNTPVFYLGGIVGGKASPASITNCANSGQITLTRGTSSSMAGGICSVLDATKGTMTNCTNCGKMFNNRDNASIAIGALIGSLSAGVKTAKTICDGCQVNAPSDNIIIYSPAKTVAETGHIGLIYGMRSGTSSAALTIGSVKIQSGIIIKQKGGDEPVIATISSGNAEGFLAGKGDAVDSNINFIYTVE